MKGDSSLCPMESTIDGCCEEICKQKIVKTNAFFHQDRNWRLLRHVTWKIEVDCCRRNEILRLFSNEQPRGERPHGGDVVNSAPQTHRSCVYDKTFRSFSDIKNRVAIFQCWFQNLHVTVFFGSNERIIVTTVDVLARIIENAWNLTNLDGESIEIWFDWRSKNRNNWRFETTEKYAIMRSWSFLRRRSRKNCIIKLFIFMDFWSGSGNIIIFIPRVSLWYHVMNHGIPGIKIIVIS